MSKSFEVKYFELEENSWWCQSRRDIITKLIKTLDINKGSKILEIGCSSGTLTKSLEQMGFANVYGIDNSRIAISLCKKRGLKNVFVMDGAKTRFKKEEFDVIIASDILEHIKNSGSALNGWRKIMKPGGILIIFVPAFNFLWSEHDTSNVHYRRYTKNGLVNDLKMADFKIDRISYWNFILFFPASIVRIFQHMFMKRKIQTLQQLYEINPILNKIIISMLKFENWFHKRLNFPVGVSIFAIARKS